MLFYMPIEAYKERYTSQLSVVDGWQEKYWKKNNIDFCRIDPNCIELDNFQTEIKSIHVGQVLDAVGRCRCAMAQITELLTVEKFTKDDVIYFEDFFHPGIESLPYIFHQTLGARENWPKMYAFLWAQTADKYDFTYPMKDWMRPFEIGIAKILDGIFVASTGLKDLVSPNAYMRNQSGEQWPIHRMSEIKKDDKVHIIGLPFDSKEVMKQMPVWWRTRRTDRTKRVPQRLNQVVWSSRWDTEKDPAFFMEVAREVLRHNEGATFIVCTSSDELRSNDPALIRSALRMNHDYGSQFQIRAGLTKEEYYSCLAQSKIQFNSALQDWVSFTLLEASVAGCFPLYPDCRSFPEALNHEPAMLYKHKDVVSAVGKILSVLEEGEIPGKPHMWDHADVDSREWIHKRHDATFERMSRIMRVLPLEDKYLNVPIISPYGDENV